MHWTLSEDIRNLKRAKDALASGQPLHLVLRSLRIWGPKEKLFERIVPRLTPNAAVRFRIQPMWSMACVKAYPLTAGPGQPGAAQTGHRRRRRPCKPHPREDKKRAVIACLISFSNTFHIESKAG